MNKEEWEDLAFWLLVTALCVVVGNALLSM